MDLASAQARVLEAAETLFYSRGVQAVGMDEVRAASGVSLKRLYQLFGSKDDLVKEFLRHRDRRWRTQLADHVARYETPRERILAVFDWLHRWFSEPDFRGCAFINAFAELSGVSPDVAELARSHKKAFRQYLRELAAAAHQPAALVDQLFLLAEGAIITAAITGSPKPARHARSAAQILLRADVGTGERHRAGRGPRG